MNILGIDIGTTSVKIAIYDRYNKIISKAITKDTNSMITSTNKYYHEQNVDKIFLTIYEILDDDIDPIQLQSIGHVGISGQMHGVMFWNEVKHSHFITWMDQRCNILNFADKLPKMPSNIVEEMSISSGYGCGTLFHLTKFDPLFFEEWKYAGNIVDFFACRLCGLDIPLMSPQIAHSWGYFDIIGNKWFTDILEKNNFPTKLLPRVVPAGTVLGQSKGLTKIPANALVYVGMGDLQCSMYGALGKNLNAAINISTSAQFAVRVNSSDLKHLSNSDREILKLPPGLVVNPNFESNDYLLVAASLNGGNVLEAFVTMLQKWVKDLSGVETPKNTIWSHLINTYQDSVFEYGDENNVSSFGTLNINPILFGERYCPMTGANISDIFPFNCTLDNIYSSICIGLVKNLTNLLPLEMVSKLEVNNLKCSGGAIKRHKCLADSIKKIYGSVINNIEFTNNYDACVGVVEYLNGIINN